MVRTSYSSGFTIIEVMLFLAISGLMVVGMFVGISGSINRQRYEDAVYSFQDYMQGQYNLVDNVRNNHDDIRVCRGGNIVEDMANRESRGTSQDCTIVGRLITTTDGRRFVSEPVFSTNSALDTTHGETALLNSLQLTTASVASDSEDYQLSWNTRVYTDKAHRDASHTAQLLILRMPDSGIVRTYFRTATVGLLNEFWSGTPPAEMALCVEPDGLIKSNPTGVRVLAKAVNANSVQFISAGAGTC